MFTKHFKRVGVAVACAAVLAAGALGVARLTTASAKTVVASSLPTDGAETSSMSGYMVAVG